MKFKNISISLFTALAILTSSCSIGNALTLNTNDNYKNIKSTQQSKSTDIYIHFLNTGNSDSILIEGPKNILIDGGDNDDEKFITSYIKKEGISKIDYLILTHPDADHCGGLDAVVESFDIGQVLVGNSSSNSKTYTDFIKALANKGLHPSVPLEGAKIKIDSNSYIQFFNTKGGSNANESSLITLLVNSKNKVLFMGDAGFETEEKILKSLPDVDLIKIGHHGSKYSTSDALLKKTSPEEAVITTGTNSYGHPHTNIISKLQSNKINYHRTDTCGTIVYKSNGSKLSVSCNENNISSEKDNNSILNIFKNHSNKVVITNNGKKYHIKGCKYATNIKSELSTTAAKLKGYSACKVCL